jgi:CheY-like chemotaxis protein
MTPDPASPTPALPKVIVGSNFAILPPELELAVHPEKATAPLRILVVDDEVSVREVLSAFLEGEGYEIQTANDGVEALEALEKSDWDLVFTDRAMPRMNGDELAAAVKQSNAKVPVVMITGFVDPKKDYQAEPRIVDVVVRKPFTFAAIRNAIVEASAACKVRKRDEAAQGES